jgi:MFS transporter, YNFM family, putative membrane transport protein
VGTHAALFGATLGGFMSLYCTQAIYPELRSRYGLTTAEAGALLTVTTLGLAFTSPFASSVARRLGPRAAVIMGIVLLAASAVLFGSVKGRVGLMGVRLLQGVLIPLVLSALLACINLLWTGADALSASATYVSGSILGGLLGRFLPAFMLPMLGWEGTFLAFGAVHLVLLPLVLMGFPHIDADEQAAPPPGFRPAEFLRKLGSVMGSAQVAGFGLLFTQVSVTTYIGIRLASEPYGWGTRPLGLLYCVFLPALIFVRLTPGAVVRFGAHRTLGSAVLLGWMGLGLTLHSSEFVILTGLVVFATAVFMGQTVLAHLVGATSKANKAVAAGAYLCCYYVGGSAGALAPSLVWRGWGWTGCLGMIAVVQLGCVALFRRLSRPGVAT